MDSLSFLDIDNTSLGIYTSDPSRRYPIDRLLTLLFIFNIIQNSIH